MGDVFDEVYNVVQCKECPWYKTCATPMRFTVEDIRRQLEASQGILSGTADLTVQNLLSSMVSAAQNSLLEACPVLVARLRSSPKLAQRLKELMQNWSREEEN